MPLLFLESYSKWYYASGCSMTTCACGVISLLAVLFPLFAAYASDDFWVRIETYHEQPTVYFNNQFTLHVLQQDDDYFYSSIVKLNDYYDKTLESPVFSVQLTDNNFDGKVDLIKLKINFKSEPSSIKNIKLMLFFEYILSKRVRMAMQSVCTVDINTLYGASYIYTNGVLNLQQKSPISAGTIAKLVYYDDIFQNSTSPYDYDSLQREFITRNVTTNYEYDKLVMPLKYQGRTEIEVDITIPSYQEVMYVLPMTTSLKKAWVQYITIFAPIAAICNALLLFILKNQVFSAKVIDDLPRA